jgi:hypothetical protein
MKKGLTLALTMLALTMLVIPASAVAPIIPNPPTVIIGNAGDEAEGKSLFRYFDAVDLLDYVDWQNPTYSEQTYRAYFSFVTDASGIDVGVSGSDAWIPALTAGEADALINSGTEPASEKNILATTSSLTLMNISASVGDPASAFLADPAVNGLETHDEATYQPSTDVEPTVMWFAAAVTDPDGGVKPSAATFIDIYSLLGEEDAWDFSQYAYISHGPGATWISSMPAAETDIVKPGTVAGGGVVGYEVAAVDDPANKIIFGQFQLGDGSASVFPIAGAGMADMAYNARARLRNADAPSADLCPGYRLEYANNGYTHFGGIEVNTYDDANAPYAGNDFWAQVFWEVPYQMTDMGDDGTLANWVYGGDYRNYQLLFDLFHKQLGDRGLFTLEEVVVEAVAKPTAAAAAITYDDLSTWIQAAYQSAAPDTFEDGTATVTADSITMQTGAKDTDAGNRFIQVNQAIDAEFTSTAMNAASNTLYQFHCDAQSLDIETTPLFRMYLQCYDTDGFAIFAEDPTAYFTNIIWFDMYGSLVPFGKMPSSWGSWAGRQGDQVPPGVPPDDAAVTASVWAYSHEISGANYFFLPELSVQSQNFYVDDTGWEDDSGGVIITNVGVKAY